MDNLDILMSQEPLQGLLSLFLHQASPPWTTILQPPRPSAQKQEKVPLVPPPPAFLAITDPSACCWST